MEDDVIEPKESEAELEDEPAGSPSLGNTFGAAVGGAMLGLELALNRQPPAEVVAAEHQPERGLIDADGRLVIEIPDVDASPKEPPR